MTEIWRYVPHTNNRYEVSNLGQVRSKYRILKTNSKSGQKCVSIVMDGRTCVFEVRHLIAYAFLDADIDDPIKPQLLHLDGDFSNICLDNLTIKHSISYDDEEWRDIAGFESIYQVSNYGRVKRLAYEEHYVRKDTGVECIRRHPERILATSKSQDGYSQINLVHQSNVKYLAVHRLVAQAFIPNPENKQQVNHIDGVRDNNVVTNLEWCTCIENVRDQIKRSGRSACILAIRKSQGKPVKCIETQMIFDSIGQAANALGCDNAAISSSIERYTCCFGWTFIYLDTCGSLNISELDYMHEARSKYFKWSRAKVKEVDGWKNMYFQEA